MNLSIPRNTQTAAAARPWLPTSFESNFRKAGTRSFVIALLVLFGLTFVGTEQAHAQAWSLTKAQRQAYLNYYAPVILKRGDENDGKQGRDWITNFDFDQDGDFSVVLQKLLFRLYSPGSRTS
jgi:hypothetical protein